MGFLLTLCLSLFSLQALADWEMSAGRLMGNYQVWVAGSSVKNIVSFNPDNSILLQEKRPQCLLRCYGKAEQENQLLKIAMICQNGRKFKQAIDFSEVRDLNSFQAPVYSTLYHQNILMNFELLP